MFLCYCEFPFIICLSHTRHTAPSTGDPSMKLSSEMSSQNDQEQIRKRPREDERESEAESLQPSESQSITNRPQMPHTRRILTYNPTSS